MEKNKYNGYLVMPLFYAFINRCMKHEGSKYSFYILMRDVADAKTIYKFLNTLEQHNGLELAIKRKKTYYAVNEKGIKKAFMSYKECQMANQVVNQLLSIAVDFDSLL